MDSYQKKNDLHEEKCSFRIDFLISHKKKKGEKISVLNPGKSTVSWKFRKNLGWIEVLQTHKIHNFFVFELLSF